MSAAARGGNVINYISIAAYGLGGMSPNIQSRHLPAIVGFVAQPPQLVRSGEHYLNTGLARGFLDAVRHTIATSIATVFVMSSNTSRGFMG